METVAVFGEPSIDHIIELSPESRKNMDILNGTWNLGPESFFYFPTPGGQEIVQLHAGRKWGHPDKVLSLDEKATLFNYEKGFLTAISANDPSIRGNLASMPGGIRGEYVRRAFGGPVRNSLEALIGISDLISPGYSGQFNVLFLGGHETATSQFEEHMKHLDGAYKDGRINVEFLRSPTWATHEAFNFEPPKDDSCGNSGDFRTLIRYQENMKEFPDAAVDKWFSENASSLKSTEKMYINSLKSARVMKNLVDFLREGYQGTVYVAPTNNMYDISADGTKALVAKADRVILNLNEACMLTGDSYRRDMPFTEKGDICFKLLRMEGSKEGKRVYISDDGYMPMAGEHSAGNLIAYGITPFKVCPKNHINAGDNFTGAALYYDLKNDGDVVQNLARASAYASFRVSQPSGMTEVNKDSLRGFCQQYDCQQVRTLDLNRKPLDTKYLF